LDQERRFFHSARGWWPYGIITGDFNATPQDKPDYPARAIPLMLSSHYHSAYDLDDPDTYTTWKYRRSKDKGNEGEKETKHTIDYIFYHAPLPGSSSSSSSSTREVRVRSRLSLPTPEEVGSEALPSLRYPSDHLAIMAEFELI